MSPSPIHNKVKPGHPSCKVTLSNAGDSFTVSLRDTTTTHEINNKLSCNGALYIRWAGSVQTQRLAFNAMFVDWLDTGQSRLDIVLREAALGTGHHIFCADFTLFPRLATT